jgi:hypothetical protein
MSKILTGPHSLVVIQQRAGRVNKLGGRLFDSPVLTSFSLAPSGRRPYRVLAYCIIVLFKNACGRTSVAPKTPQQQKCESAVLDRQLLRHVRRAFTLNSSLQAFATIQPVFSATIPLQHIPVTTRPDGEYYTKLHYRARPCNGHSTLSAKAELNSLTGLSFRGGPG